MKIENGMHYIHTDGKRRKVLLQTMKTLMKCSIMCYVVVDLLFIVSPIVGVCNFSMFMFILVLQSS